MNRLILFSGLIILAFLADFCSAGIPQMINYQGMLTDDSGNPLTDTVDITFIIYDDPGPTGGNVKWDETQYGVPVINGLFNVILGSVDPVDLDFDQDYWLDITVEGEHMPERLRLTSVAYSYKAEDAEAVKGISASTTPTANSLFPLGSNAKFPEEVIPSDLTPGPHDHIGEVWNAAISWSNSAFKVTNSLNGPSIWGVNTGGGNALRGNGYGSGMGLYAESESVTAAICRGENSWGMEAYGKDGSLLDRWGDLLLGGTYGEIFTFGKMDIYSDEWVIIDLDDNNDEDANFRIVNGTDAIVFNVDEYGNYTAPGIKSTMVQTATHGERLLHSMESPGVWFEDFGKTSLINGEATVAFEPIFSEAVNLQEDYHVFLTPLSQEPVLLFVTAKDTKAFSVRGMSLNGQPTDCSFDYRIVAKRRGYEPVRLEPVSFEANQKGSIR